MTKTLWTPGPWSVPHFADDDTQCNCGYVLAEYGGMGAIATVHVCKEMRGDWGDDEGPDAVSARANAHLIAAAPDLYEALADLAAAYKSLCLMTGKTFYEDDCSQYQRSTAALAKARGETE